MAETDAGAGNSSPTPADRAAADEFLSELRTRIATQSLPYQYGSEERALKSLVELFEQARDAIKKHPGCRQFADLVTATLNLKVRPVTAKWHRAQEEGRLKARDGADEFRADLMEAQEELRLFAAKLYKMAYGPEAEAPGAEADDEESLSALRKADLDACFGDVSFRIVTSPLIPDEKIVGAINEAEREAVQARRSYYGIGTKSGMNAVGLALSGGGIRSATFSLGVVQVLAQRGLLKDVDFLSTVSGGGYTGSFLTTRVGGREAGPESKASEAGNENPHADIAAPHGPDPAPVRYLRQHAKYLAALNLVHAWQMVTATLAGMLLNWTAPLLVVALAALVALAATRIGSLPGITWLRVMTVLGAASTLMLVWYGWRLRNGRKASAAAGAALGWTLAVTTAAGAGWLLQLGYLVFEKAVSDSEMTAARWTLLSGGLLATLATTVAPAIIRFIPVLEKPAVRQLTLKGLLWFAGLVIPIGAVALFYALVYVGLHVADGVLILVGLGAVFAVVAILGLNVNLTGLHRLYRDQLARTFIQPDEKTDAPVPLPDLNAAGRAPYHLINAAVNLPASAHAALRDRKTDFFLFSRHWCGSPATGYYPTAEWRANGSALDLATAMAISGAAASPHMGLSSMPTLAALLTFLNLRLGFWILHPERNVLFKSPGFLCLLREMTGFGMSENHAWLNLSDGGHIENMAIYELLRRRCKFIICVDGEGDPGYSFQGLMTLIRHAQIDFGIGIDAALDDLRPDPATGCCRTHAVLCRIHYPDGARGLLLCLKLSLTGNEPEMLRRYHLLRSDFPHQSTFDQFFSEEQFEAYRQLGVHVAESLFLPAITGGNTKPKSVPEWFRSLAANLLQAKRG